MSSVKRLHFLIIINRFKGRRNSERKHGTGFTFLIPVQSSKEISKAQYIHAYEKTRFRIFRATIIIFVQNRFNHEKLDISNSFIQVKNYIIQWNLTYDATHAATASY